MQQRILSSRRQNCARVVESRKPEQVPFDLAAELHLKFDAVAVAYRQAMREQELVTQRKTVADSETEE
jgi:hypothetical protein